MDREAWIAGRVWGSWVWGEDLGVLLVQLLLLVDSKAVWRWSRLCCRCHSPWDRSWKKSKEEKRSCYIIEALKD